MSLFEVFHRSRGNKSPLRPSSNKNLLHIFHNDEIWQLYLNYRRSKIQTMYKHVTHFLIYADTSDYADIKN